MKCKLFKILYLLLDYMDRKSTTIIHITGDVNSPITVNNSTNYWLPTEMFSGLYNTLPNKERIGSKVIATVASALVHTNCLPTVKPPCFGDGNQLANFYLSNGFTDNTVSEGAIMTANGPEYTWVETGYKGQHPSLQNILEIQNPTKVSYIIAGNTLCDTYAKMELSVEKIQKLLNRFERLSKRYAEYDLQRLYYATIVAGLCQHIPFGTPYSCPVI